MYLEGVTICSRYQDYLAWFLLCNKPIFNKLVVVTGEDEWEVSNLCRHYNVTCVKTNLFKDNFNKAAAINVGLNHLARTDWLCHIDCDIILPPRTREMLDVAQLQKDTLYSALRMDVIGFDEWIKFLMKPAFIHEKEIYLHYPYKVSALVSKTFTKDVDFEFEKGYCPVGYLQIFHDNGTKKLYPESPKSQASAARNDMEFSLMNWPKRIHRQLIPELNCLHLMMPDGKEKGVNWGGRKTQKFGPTPIDEKVE